MSEEQVVTKEQAAPADVSPQDNGLHSPYVREQVVHMVKCAVTHADNGTTDSTGEVFHLPIEHYSAPRWEDEMNAIYRRLPLMLGLSAELPKPGSYKAIKILNVPVLIVRGDDKKVRAFINTCTHRGRALTHAVNESGQCKQGFVCPYHAWRFGTNGALLNVADPRKFGEVNKAERGLKELFCDERAGFIWVCITPGLTFDMVEQLGGMLAELEGLQADKWYVHGTSILQSANWKITYDGYLESYHIPFLHRETLYPMWGRQSATSVSIYDFYGPLQTGPHMRMAGNAWGYDPKLMANMKGKPESEYNGHHYHAVRTLFPNISISADMFGGLVSLLIPTAPDHCITHQIHVNRRNPADFTSEETDAMKKRIALYAKVVEDEDYATSFSIQEGVTSGGNVDILFGKNEGGAANFHKSVQHYVEAYRKGASTAGK
jgi:phenylpropionate dioxygenase-like ring-hydroxylating dioxygenase large terminal subunit